MVILNLRRCQFFKIPSVSVVFGPESESLRKEDPAPFHRQPPPHTWILLASDVIRRAFNPSINCLGFGKYVLFVDIKPTSTVYLLLYILSISALSRLSPQSLTHLCISFDKAAMCQYPTVSSVSSPNAAPRHRL